MPYSICPRFLRVFHFWSYRGLCEEFLVQLDPMRPLNVRRNPSQVVRFWSARYEYSFKSAGGVDTAVSYTFYSQMSHRNVPTAANRT